MHEACLSLLRWVKSKTMRIINTNTQRNETVLFTESWIGN